MQLRGVVEDVELVHWTLQADASQLEVHGELEEPADRAELQLAVVSDESSCSTKVTCLCLLPPPHPCQCPAEHSRCRSPP